MPIDRDYYNVLGVSRSADAEEIKRAYRTLAMKWHPDRNPGDTVAELRFKAINEAYRVLSDPDQRTRYDRMGPLFTEDGRPPRPDEVSDVLGRVWNNLWGRRKRTPGEDLRYTLTVTLEEVAAGSSREIVVPRQLRCVACHGLGAPASGRQVCKHCEGSGRSTGVRLLRSTCYHCDGRGFTVQQPCGVCAGEGRVGSTEALKVRVPPGVATGQKLKVAGKGNEAADGSAPGELYVVVNVSEHDLFHRRGDDLVAQVPVTFAEAALGADVMVPTLDGRTTIRVPPGTEHGRTFRLAGRGLPHVGRSTRGDLHLEIQVEIPQGLDEAERARLDAWLQSLPPGRHPRRQAFLRATGDRS